MVDVTNALAPKSDQLNADDLIAGPLTVHVTGAGIGAEDRIAVHTSEFPSRPWKPSKGMGRFLATIWGKDTDDWAGQSVTLYRDPEVMYGGKKAGGIRIQAMTSLEKAFTGPLRITRGKSIPFTIQPLTVEHGGLTDAQIAACTDLDELRAMWSSASTVQQEQINARAAQLAQEVQE